MTVNRKRNTDDLINELETKLAEVNAEIAKGINPDLPPAQEKSRLQVLSKNKRSIEKGLKGLRDIKDLLVLLEARGIYIDSDESGTRPEN
jgi:hypothetical protein